MVEQFLPSKHGFHFTNTFEPSWYMLGLANSAAGFCGGMVLTAHDLYNYGVPVPALGAAPLPGMPLFNYIRSRQLDSVNLPWGALRVCWETMTGGDKYHRSAESVRSRVYRTMEKVRPPRSVLVPLNLIYVHSWNPFETRHNHQVLCYHHGGELGTTLSVYDPNYPDRDDITITMDHIDRAITHSEDGPVRAVYPTVFGAPSCDVLF